MLNLEQIHRQSSGAASGERGGTLREWAFRRKLAVIVQTLSRTSRGTLLNITYIALFLLTLSCETPAPQRAVSRLGALELGPLVSGPSIAPERAPPTLAPAFARPGERGPEPRSLGPTNAGLLIDGLPPAESEALRLRPIAISRGAIFGTRALVGMLERAAARVARRFPGSTLWTGDLSLASGGPVSPHASHQNGRDVDLAFYISNDDGPADVPAMRHVNERLETSHGHFDVARNWALIESFLDDPEAQVQWIFVATHLRKALLDFGRAENSPLLERAERVLAEPRDSSAHADHFHVRIYCGLAERLEGCLDAPPFHPWVDRHEDALSRWLEGLLPFLEAPRWPEIGHAIEGIVRMNATSALPHLGPLRDHPDPSVAELARDAYDFLRGHRTPEAWARWRATDARE
jgi:penicillin-insensitive murein endopeptidase